MIKKALLFLVIVFCLLLIGVYFFQEKVIFLPQKKIAKDYQYKFEQKFEEVNLKTSDNITINGLYFIVDNPKGAILFFHGNKGNLNRWGKIVQYFSQYQYNVFVIDYSGYGKSTGTFNETKMYKDALLSYDFLKQKFPESKIVVYGRSLGATFATKVASENNPKELILEAPFFNLYEATKHYIFPLPKFLMRYKFESNKDISKVKSPITIFHGTEDSVTSFLGSKELFNLNNNTLNEFVKIDNGTHHNLRDYKLYNQTLSEKLNR